LHGRPADRRAHAAAHAFRGPGAGVDGAPLPGRPAGEPAVPGAARRGRDVPRRVLPALAHLGNLEQLRSRTSLPILLKGIQDPRDAALALEHGVDGIVVSNHGGRQVDGAIGSLDALPGVVEEVDGRIPVLFDSGIRSGADAFKALALGAQAVLVGRPWVYGLALGGSEGVRAVMEHIWAELDLTMALTGVAGVGQISRDLLR
jgi:isopentenyl diphosphate isomerase/L-lactate dehydrogenase-like FMN-dependent dehydrogenase